MNQLALGFGIAVAIGLFWLGVRRDVFARLANFHEDEASRLMQEESEATDEAIESHRAASSRYRRTARSPWRRVED
jgi:hypothetical protein